MLLVLAGSTWLSVDCCSLGRYRRSSPSSLSKWWDRDRMAISDIGVLAVITLSASAATWSGCFLTFCGVHLSKQRIRTSTDRRFKFA